MIGPLDSQPPAAGAGGPPPTSGGRELPFPLMRLCSTYLSELDRIRARVISKTWNRAIYEAGCLIRARMISEFVLELIKNDANRTAGLGDRIMTLQAEVGPMPTVEQLRKMASGLADLLVPLDPRYLESIWPTNTYKPQVPIYDPTGPKRNYFDAFKMLLDLLRQLETAVLPLNRLRFDLSLLPKYGKLDLALDKLHYVTNEADASHCLRKYVKYPLSKAQVEVILRLVHSFNDTSAKRLGSNVLIQNARMKGTFANMFIRQAFQKRKYRFIQMFCFQNCFKTNLDLALDLLDKIDAKTRRRDRQKIESLRRELVLYRDLFAI